MRPCPVLFVLATTAAVAVTGCGGGGGGGGTPAPTVAKAKTTGTSDDDPAPAKPEAPKEAPKEAPAGTADAGDSGPVAAPPASAGGGGDATALAMGINLNAVTFYSPEWPFVDVFKTSRTNRDGKYPWTLINPQGRSNPPLDADGYPKGLAPGQVAKTLCLVETGAPYPAGRYTVRFEGDGEVELAGDAETTSYDHDGVGTAQFEVEVKNPSQRGLAIRILRSESGDHVRGIRVIMPGFAAKPDAFHPAFLESLRPFRVLRFMDWGETNHSELRRWSDRKKVSARTQFRHGVAYEHMIRLCNQLQKDAWVCVPHQADDDFVRQLARLFADRLAPGLKVYLEYSNEVWNASFSQHQYARQKGQQSGEPWHAFYARRSAECFRLAEGALGGRLVRVVAGHGQNPWVNERILDALPSPGAADAMAIAPYFGGLLGKPDAWQKTRGMSVEQVLEACRKDVRGRIREMIRENVALARERGVALIAYEGGQHLVGVGGQAVNDGQLTRLLNEANRRPAMGEIYREYLDIWAQEGGGLFCAFSSCYRPGKHGSWGLREHQLQDDAPKYRAVRAAAQRWRQASP